MLLPLLHLVTTLGCVIPLLIGTRGMLPSHVTMGQEHSTAVASFIQFDEIQQSDEGTYVCLVTNSAGITESFFELQVERMY